MIDDELAATNPFFQLNYDVRVTIYQTLELQDLFHLLLTNSNFKEIGDIKLKYLFPNVRKDKSQLTINDLRKDFITFGAKKEKLEIEISAETKLRALKEIGWATGALTLIILPCLMCIPFGYGLSYTDLDIYAVVGLSIACCWTGASASSLIMVALMLCCQDNSEDIDDVKPDKLDLLQKSLKNHLKTKPTLTLFFNQPSAKTARSQSLNQAIDDIDEIRLDPTKLLTNLG